MALPNPAYIVILDIHKALVHCLGVLQVHYTEAEHDNDCFEWESNRGCVGSWPNRRTIFMGADAPRLRILFI